MNSLPIAMGCEPGEENDEGKSGAKVQDSGANPYVDVEL
jgi:hypothetical protein